MPTIFDMLKDIIRKDDTYAFHELMANINDCQYAKTIEDLTGNYIQKIAQSLINFWKNYAVRGLKFRMQTSIKESNERSITLMKILIEDYDFIPEKNFMIVENDDLVYGADTTVTCAITFPMFMMLYNYFEYFRSVYIVKHVFENQCYFGGLENAQRILEMGYDIGCFNERAILIECIERRDIKMLKMLAAYGINFKVLNDESTKIPDDIMEIHNLLLNDVNTANILGLIKNTRTSEWHEYSK